MALERTYGKGRRFSLRLVNVNGRVVLSDSMRLVKSDYILPEYSLSIAEYPFFLVT